MKSSLIIKKNNLEDVNNLYDNIENVIIDILELDDSYNIKKDNNNIYIYYNDILYCRCNIDYTYDIIDAIINIKFNDREYIYHCDEEAGRLNVMLREYYFKFNDINYKVIDLGSILYTYIEKDNKQIFIEVEDSNKDNSNINNILKTINIDDSIELLYNKLLDITDCSNIKIKKSNLISNDSEHITDLLIIKDNELSDYYVTTKNKINDKNYEYIFKKQSNNYTVTFLDGSLEDFASCYFVLNNQVNFINKINSKNNKYRKIKQNLD